MIWAALREAQVPGTGCPPGCAWAKTFAISLKWIEAFLEQEEVLAGADLLQRTYVVAYYKPMQDAVHICIVTDASPWGLAGVLMVNMEVRSWFSSTLTSHDVELFEHEIGSPKGQQAWEALACLVAARCWQQTWMGHRVRLEVKSDSINSLHDQGLEFQGIWCESHRTGNGLGLRGGMLLSRHPCTHPRHLQHPAGSP